MSREHIGFKEQLDQLRRGNSDAIAGFVDEYGPYLRRSLRFRIRGTALQSAADSVDICQSVLGGFLLRLAAGGYEVNSKEDLHRLLAAIANKKFLMFQRREYAEKRSRKITLSIDQMPEPIEPNADDVGQEIEMTELWEKASKLMNSEEQDLLQRRKDGHSWENIAQDMNVSSLLLRKRLSRALRRVADELGLDY